MTYLIIHTNPKVLEKEVLILINRYLDKNFTCLEDIINMPDFHIIKPEEGKESITIEQGKKLQSSIMYSPLQNKNQFGIIPNAHLMTTQAQNSLLKTFEEKNENTILILTVNNEKAILETILSRCTRIYPKGDVLEEKSSDFKEEIYFLEKPLNEKLNYIEHIIKENNTDIFLEGLLKYYQKEYLIKTKTGNKDGIERETLQILKDVKFRIRKNVNKKIALEYLCFKLDCLSEK